MPFGEWNFGEREQLSDNLNGIRCSKVDNIR